MRKIIKVRFNRLCTILLSIIMMLQPITAYAGSDGYSEPALDNVNSHIYFSDYSGEQLVYDYIGTDGKNYKAIVLPILSTNDSQYDANTINPKEEYYTQLYNKIMQLNLAIQGDTRYNTTSLYQEVLELVSVNEDWPDLKRYIEQLPSASEQADAGWSKGMTTEQSENIQNSNYRNNIALTYTGSDTLIAWRQDRHDSFIFGERPSGAGLSGTHSPVTVPGTGITFIQVGMVPIVAKNNTQYVTTEDLHVGDIIDADAIIFSHTNNHIFAYYPDSTYPTFGNGNKQMSKAQKEDIVSVMNPLYILPVTQLNGSAMDVHQWKVLNIYDGSDAFKDNSICVFDSGASSYTYLTWDTSEYGVGTSEFANDTMWIELEPIYNKTYWPTPDLQVVNETYIQMTAKKPHDILGQLDPDDYELNDFYNYFYATTNLDTELEDIIDVYDDECTYYGTSEDGPYLVQPGTYRIFKDSAYWLDNDLPSYDSDEIDYADITIEMPELTAPPIVITDEDGLYTATYTVLNPTMPSTGTEVYTDYVTTRRFIVTDPSYVLSGTILPDSTTADLAVAKDTLSEGYNKIYTQTVLSLPKDILGNTATVYYSTVNEKVVYVDKSLAAPVITDLGENIQIKNNDPNSIALGAEDRYVYCTYADDEFEGLAAEELSSSASDYDDVLPKKDGISVAYAYSVAEEMIDGITYYTYSDVVSAVFTKEYVINDVLIGTDAPTVDLTSGGYSSPLTDIDTSTIYYIVTDTLPTDSELANLIDDAHKYTSPFEREDGAFYATAVEVVMSDNGEGTVLTSTGEPATVYFPAKTLTVTYDGNGGTPSVKKHTKTYQEAYGELATATRKGYSFVDWMYNDDTITSDSIVEVAEDHTLVAEWDAISYTVRYHNSAKPTESMDDSIFAFDVEDNLRKSTFTHDGYVLTLKNGDETTKMAVSALFEGWSLVEDERTVDFTDEEKVKNLADTDGDIVDIYAVWVAEGVMLPELEKDGYYFDGWNDGEDIHEPGKIYVPDGDTTLTAEWREIGPVSYTVRYNNPAKPTESMRDSVFTLDVADKLRKNTFTHDGYTLAMKNGDEVTKLAVSALFEGWSLLEDSRAVDFTDEETVINLADTDGDIVDIYAVWTADGILLPELEKDGSVFDGWSDGTDIYAPGEVYVPNGDTTLTAQWHTGRYYVSFNANGGSGHMNTITIEYGKDVTLPANEFTRGGYHFIGWTTDKDSSVIQYPDKAHMYQVTGKEGTTINLYAIWAADTSNSGNTNNTPTPVATQSVENVLTGDYFSTALCVTVLIVGIALCVGAAILRSRLVLSEQE